MKRHNPKISVILPTYNRAGLLKNAVESVLSQTFKNFELIIVNDGSEDHTEDVALKIKDTRVVYIKKRNGGVSTAKNAGIARARGAYITYLGDDDIYYPEHLCILSRYLDRHPRTALVYGQVHFKMGAKVFIPYDFNYSKKRLEIDDIIPANSLMHRKKCIDTVGYFDINLPVSQDWDMWLRIADKYTIRHVNDIVAQVRFHAGGNRSERGDFYRSDMRIIKNRVLMAKEGLIRGLPFEGYYAAVAYRMVHKFKAKKDICIDFMRELADIDSKNCEAGLCLCLCHLAYKDYEKTAKKTLDLLKGFSRKKYAYCSLGEWLFNAYRILGYAYLRLDRHEKSRRALNESVKYIARAEKPRSSYTDLTGLISRFLNRL